MFFNAFQLYKNRIGDDGKGGFTEPDRPDPFLLIPSLFNALIVLTTKDRPITLHLASIPEGTFFKVSERNETLVFIALAAAGFIAAFLGLNLIQKHIGVDRRLVLCGYRPSELIIAKLTLLLFCDPSDRGVCYIIALVLLSAPP